MGNPIEVNGVMYEPVIGLEVHVQLKTQSKIFCGCPTEFGAEPNTHVCPVCCGYPGVLPVLNKQAVQGLVKTALALNCRINPRSIFARKQYFYPDLPKNYQISQYELPLAEGGYLDLEEEGEPKRIRIHRIHLEEDAGKLLHAIGNRRLDYSLVDLNRTGVPLMEIVSEPEIGSPEQASAYLTKLKSIVRTLGVSDCDMEKGSLRCDANISIRPAGSETLGAKAEIKNMNSFKGVRDALAYEIERQALVLENGDRVVQETRLWDANKGVSQSMRSKEEAHDYRYFPEPDLVAVELDKKTLEDWQSDLPELPDARQQRFETDLGLPAYDAQVLTADRALADFFEEGLTVASPGDRKALAKPLSNWVITELLGRLNAAKKEVTESPVPPGHIGTLAQLVQKGTISGKIAKTVFDDMWASGQDPESIVKEKGLVQVGDENQIAQWVEEVIAAQTQAVADVRSGNERALGSLVGGVMKKSKGRANPQLVNQILRKKLQVGQ